MDPPAVLARVEVRHPLLIQLDIGGDWSANRARYCRHTGGNLGWFSTHFPFSTNSRCLADCVLSPMAPGVSGSTCPLKELRLLGHILWEIKLRRISPHVDTHVHTLICLAWSYWALWCWVCNPSDSKTNKRLQKYSLFLARCTVVSQHLATITLLITNV